MHSKIMDTGDLENIVGRLKGCCSLLRILYEAASMCVTPEEALSALTDLLESVCTDFEENIAAAKNFTSATEVAP